jgi:glycosyltransferase 2 family protein
VSVAQKVDPIPEAAVAERPARRIKPGLILKLLVAVAATGVLLAQAGLDRLAQTLRGAEWSWVLLAIVSATLAMVVNVKRWQLMIRGQGANAPLPSLLRLYLVGMFLSNILPSRLGADVVRAYGVSLMATTKTQSAAAVLMDRLVGAISVLVLGMVAIVLNASNLPDPYLHVMTGFFMISLVMLGLMLYRNDRLANLRLRVLKLTEISIFGFKLRPRLESALNALRTYSRKPGVVVQGFLISLIANGLSMVNLYLYARAVRADVTLGDVATISPFILAIGLLPISINGIGTIEATFVVLFGALNVPQPVALAIAILRRLALLVLSAVGGGLYATRRFS